MKILFLNPVTNLGGAERSLLEILCILVKNRPNWKHWLVVPQDGPLAQAAESVGIDVVFLPMPVGLQSIGDSGLSGVYGVWRIFVQVVSLPYKLYLLWRYLSKLKSVINRIQPDIIHSNGFKFHVILGLMGKLQAKKIWHARDFVSNRFFVGKLLNRVCRKPELLIANSKAVLLDWIHFFPKLKSIVLYNSVDISGMEKNKQYGSHLFGIKLEGSVRVGLVGSFAKWKGHHVFLDAIKILNQESLVNNAEFFIVGGPLYLTLGSQWTPEELKHQAIILGISNRLTFVPHQSDMNPVYEGLDVVVHASTRPEPFGRTIIEGMAHGKAVVAALGGGVGEIIEDGTDALVYKAGDARDLAEKLKGLIKDRELRKRLGEAGFMKVSQSFSRGVLTEKVISIFQQLGSI